MSTRAMIMAAGIGTRLDPLTICKPKPMVPVANIPVMEHILHVLKQHNISEVIANTHYLASQISSYFNAIKPDGINIQFLHEDELSGTAGGVKKCQYFLDQGKTFVVMSADSLTDVNLTALIKKHREAGSIASMALKEVPIEEVIHLGVVVTESDGRIIEFQEKPAVEEARSNLVNTGIYIFEPALFDYIPPDCFYDFAKQVFPALMRDKKPLYGFKIDEYWNDIGTINQYRLSSYDAIENRVKITIPGRKFEHGYEGGNLIQGRNISYNSTVIFGGNCTIEDNVTFSTSPSIGSNCMISEGARLNGCIIWDNVRIGKNAHLNKCLIGNNVTISDNAIIEEGSVIADNCMIRPGACIPANSKIHPNEVYA